MVYLLHFERPYQARTGHQKKQALHYLGYTNNLDSRIADHRAGLGARLLEVITADGIGFTVARTWEAGDRKLERRLKNRKRAACLCPCCDPERAKRNGAKHGGSTR